MNVLFNHNGAIVTQSTIDLKNDIVKYRIAYGFQINQVNSLKFEKDAFIIMNVYMHDPINGVYTFLNNHKSLVSDFAQVSETISAVYLNKEHQIVFVFNYDNNDKSNFDNEKENISVNIKLRILEYGSEYAIYQTLTSTLNVLQDVNYKHAFNLKAEYMNEKINTNYTIDIREAKTKYPIERIIDIEVFVENNIRNNRNIIMFGKYQVDNYLTNQYKQYFVSGGSEISFSTKDDVFVIAIMNTTEVVGDERLYVKMEGYTKELVILENAKVAGFTNLMTDNVIYFLHLKIIEDIETETIDVFSYALPNVYDLFSRKFKNYSSFINNEFEL